MRRGEAVKPETHREQNRLGAGRTKAHCALSTSSGCNADFDPITIRPCKLVVQRHVLQPRETQTNDLASQAKALRNIAMLLGTAMSGASLPSISSEM